MHCLIIRDRGRQNTGMKILAISDVESKFFYDFYTPGKLKEFDLIISCGDLKAKYLEFLVTMARCPLLYVHGNHDEAFKSEPEGCTCIDDTLYTYEGLRIMGLGGCYRYRDGQYMYTETQMRKRIARMRYKLRRAGGTDILVTHAPARGINDFDNISHRGFECFTELLDKYEPSFFIHGHVHKTYGKDIPQRSTYGKTTVINAYDYCISEI